MFTQVNPNYKCPFKKGRYCSHWLYKLIYCILIILGIKFSKNSRDTCDCQGDKEVEQARRLLKTQAQDVALDKIAAMAYGPLQSLDLDGLKNTKKENFRFRDKMKAEQMNRMSLNLEVKW